MSVPKFFEFFPIVLQTLLDKSSKTVKQIREESIELLSVSDTDCQELLPSGRQRKVDNRVNWAITYLKNAGLITAVHRGTYVITDEGCKAYAEVGNNLDLTYLEKYESFRNFHGAPNPVQVNTPIDEAALDDTPQDMLEKAHAQITSALGEEILTTVMEHSPRFFEQLVVDLLLKMGYGSAFDTSGLVVGQSGDEGIDGIIREDKLGFSSIYIQAKRWDPSSTVGRPEIQKFVGALAGQGASKGLFITTAQFSKEAIQYAQKQLAVKVVLIDGRQLTRLMIEYDIGVSVQTTYTIKKIDSDYFDDNLD